MLVRGLSGLVIGLVYGGVVGVLAFLWWRLTNDPAYPGPMIPDRNVWGEIFVIFMTIVASICGVKLAMTVSLARAPKKVAALAGAILGLLMFLINVWDVWERLLSNRSYVWREMLETTALHLVLFPLGLILTGVTASVVVNKLRL